MPDITEEERRISVHDLPPEIRQQMSAEVNDSLAQELLQKEGSTPDTYWQIFLNLQYGQNEFVKNTKQANAYLDTYAQTCVAQQGQKRGLNTLFHQYETFYGTYDEKQKAYRYIGETYDPGIADSLARQLLHFGSVREIEAVALMNLERGRAARAAELYGELGRKYADGDGAGKDREKAIQYLETCLRYRSSGEYREKLNALYCKRYPQGTAQEQKEYCLSTMAKRRLLGAPHEYAEYLDQKGNTKEAVAWHIVAGDPVSGGTAQDVAGICAEKKLWTEAARWYLKAGNPQAAYQMVDIWDKDVLGQVLPVWYEFPKYRQSQYFKSLRFFFAFSGVVPELQKRSRKTLSAGALAALYTMLSVLFAFWRALAQPFLFFAFGVILVGAAYHFSMREGRWDWLVWASAFWTYVNMRRDKAVLKKGKLNGPVLRTWQYIEQTAAAHPRLAVFEKAFNPDGEVKGNTAVFLLPTLFLLVLSIVFWLYPHGWWTGEKMAVHFPSIRITSGPSAETNQKEEPDHATSEALQAKTQLLEQSIQKRIQSNKARQAARNSGSMEQKKETAAVEDNAPHDRQENTVTYDPEATQEKLLKVFHKFRLSINGDSFSYAWDCLTPELQRNLGGDYHVWRKTLGLSPSMDISNIQITFHDAHTATLSCDMEFVHWEGGTGRIIRRNTQGEFVFVYEKKSGWLIQSMSF